MQVTPQQYAKSLIYKYDITNTGYLRNFAHPIELAHLNKLRTLQVIVPYEDDAVYCMISDYADYVLRMSMDESTCELKQDLDALLKLCEDYHYAPIHVNKDIANNSGGCVPPNALMAIQKLTHSITSQWLLAGF